MISTTNKESTSTNSIQEIKSLLQESQQLNSEISNVMKDILPLEFESYTDYFIINTFKRGRSESGKVDMLDLMRRDHSRYYQKIKRSSTKNNVSNNSKDKSSQPDTKESSNSIENGVTPPPSTSSSLDYLHKLNNLGSDNDNNDDKKKRVRMTRSRAQTEDSGMKDGNQTPTDSNWDGLDVDELEDVYNNESDSKSIVSSVPVVENQSISDIKDEHVGEEEEEGNSNDYRRRSSRISKKQEQMKIEAEKQRQLKKQLMTQGALERQQQKEMNGDDMDAEVSMQSDNDDELSDIKDLYETLVPKIKNPSRRSDWVLPPRLKYQPEKPIRTKVVVDSIKVHELIDTDRITKVLSHFEGGVAGIRKTFNTNRASVTPQATTTS